MRCTQYSFTADDGTTIKIAGPQRERTAALIKRALMQAHYQSYDDLITHARHTLFGLWISILVSLGLLLIFGAALAVES